MTELAAQPSDPASLAPPVGRRYRPAAPAAGRPFTTEAARWSVGVLQAEELIRAGLGTVSLARGLAEAGPLCRSGQRLSAKSRAARRLVAAWLAGVLIDDLDTGASLLDAEMWFTGAGSTAAGLSLDCARPAQAILQALVSRDGALEMFPYALDPIPHEYRRSVLRDVQGGASRAARKGRGSFFTPADVADHIVDLALESVDVHRPGLRLLDPAAGTGAFLRSAFGVLLSKGVPVTEALSAIHGIDLDECCVDMAAFVLLVDFFRAVEAVPTGPALAAWSDIRSRLVSADALLALRGRCEGGTSSVAASTGPAWLQEPFDVIVGNPPYARLGERTDLAELRMRYRALEGATAGTDCYPAFVELLCSRLAPDGAGSLVVPMSIGYSTTQQLRHLRETVTGSLGDWTFEFYDRTPDALFGDDIKQRTAIVTRAPSTSYSVTTGPVIRWTSRSRAGLFDRLPRVALGALNLVHGVPKLGSSDQAFVHRSLRARGEALETDLVRCHRATPPLGEHQDTTIYVAGTAYNWLSVYRTAQAVGRGVENPTTSPVLALTTASAFDADVVYAFLSSRLAFWIWRVEGDAFHVTSKWVAGLPLSLSTFPGSAAQRVAALGRALWEAIVEHPVVSVNGGRRTVSYCPHAQPELLNAIDREFLIALDLPISFGVELAAFVRDLTTAGRDAPTGHGLRRALASWRED